MTDTLGEDRLLDEVERAVKNGLTVDTREASGALALQYHAWLARLCARVRHLEAELAESYDGWRLTLEERPQKNGEYAHLLICNGDRRQPPGRSGISCSCRVGGEQRRISKERVEQAEAASQRLTEALRYFLEVREPEHTTSDCPSKSAPVDWTAAGRDRGCATCRLYSVVGAGAPPEDHPVQLPSVNPPQNGPGGSQQ